MSKKPYAPTTTARSYEEATASKYTPSKPRHRVDNDEFRHKKLRTLVLDLPDMDACIPCMRLASRSTSES
eukprot:2243790-Pleurochrysis_carterae.AAC.2